MGIGVLIITFVYFKWKIIMEPYIYQIVDKINAISSKGNLSSIR